MDAQLHFTPDNPPPENYTCGTFQGARGARLRYAIFRAADTVARGTVVLLHGRNESIEKYFETIRDLNAMGLWVATYDHRGQGTSDRLHRNSRRGHIRRFSDYEQDLSIFLTDIVLPDTRLPFFLIAHSTGALMALSAAPNLANRIERMALCAPFLGIPSHGRAVRALTTLARLVGLSGLAIGKDKGPPPFADNLVTSDPYRYRRNLGIISAFPELSLGPPSSRWLNECLRAMDRVMKPQHLTRITIPTIILAPTLDQLVPYRYQEELARRFRAAQFIPIAGAQHEIFQERDIFRAQALGAIAAFMPGSDSDENGIGASF